MEYTEQEREDYLKIHVAVNIKTKKILALEVTDEKIHDNKMLKKLVNHVLKKYSGEEKQGKEAKISIC